VDRRERGSRARNRGDICIVIVIVIMIIIIIIIVILSSIFWKRNGTHVGVPIGGDMAECLTFMQLICVR
jgi:flagellar basal body-associated protein FliL